MLPHVTATPAGQTSPPATGLRERSKLRRRNRILHTAMRLFTERGYEATTVADIAAAAELAPRTVTGYFPSKIDMATAVTDDVADRLASALTAAGGADGADFVTMLDRWLTTEFTANDFELIRLSADMHQTNPALRAVSNSHVTAATALRTTVIASQLGVPPDHPAVTICVGAMGNALGTYIATLAKRGPDEQLHRWFLNFMTAMLSDAQITD